MVRVNVQDLPAQSDEHLPPESEAQALADQMSTLVEKAQHVKEANELLSGTKLLGAPSSSVDDKTSPEDPALSLEDDVKVKAD